MRNQADVLAKILFLAVKGKTSGEKKRIIKNLVAFLREKRKIYLLPRILESYQEYLKRKSGFLVFSREIDKKTIEKLKKVFKDILEESEAVEIKINKTLIGGFMLKTENFLVDASIKELLEKYSKNLWKLASI